MDILKVKVNGEWVNIPAIVGPEGNVALNELVADYYDNSETYTVGDFCIYDNALYKCSTEISTAEDFTIGHWTKVLLIDEINQKVSDVQIDGSSILNNGVANVPLASTNNLGVFKVGAGVYVSSSTGSLYTDKASIDNIKIGTNGYKPIVPSNQHESVFYGLAKAAGYDMSNSENAIGEYSGGAKGKILNMLGVTNLIATYESDILSDNSYAPGDCFCFGQGLWKATAQINIGDAFTDNNCQLIKIGEDFVKNTDYASTTDAGVIKVDEDYGLRIVEDGTLKIYAASDSVIKTGTNSYRPIASNHIQEAAFYGLAKAAGDTTQSLSSNAVGTYTPEAKVAIKNMLGVTDSALDIVVTGTDPVITARANARYVCGEVSTITFTPSSTGICEVLFTSGSTVAILTLPSTVKMPVWFDATTLEADTIYDISITDGVYGTVMTWDV